MERKESEGRTEATLDPLDRDDSSSFFYFFDSIFFYVFTVGGPPWAFHQMHVTPSAWQDIPFRVCVCVCLLSLWRLSTRECGLGSLFDVDHGSPLLPLTFSFFLSARFIIWLYRMRHWDPPRLNRLCGHHRRFSKGSLICEKMSERNPFRPTSSGSSGALVTDARLSQLFDPIARLVDVYPPNDRRNGGYHNQRDSSEYTHLTAYPAIIEPVTYDDGTTR